MKIAIISDIHANLEALNEVLTTIHQQQIHTIFCLGDIIGYGPNPNECLELVAKNCSRTLLGNHEAALLNPQLMAQFSLYARQALQYQITIIESRWRDWLATLPFQSRDCGLSLAHSCWSDPLAWLYLTFEKDFEREYELDETVFPLFIGHTHIPMIVEKEKKNHLSMSKKTELDFDPNSSYIINVGSVGQPRDHNPDACFVIMDTETCKLVFHRIPYPYQETMKKIKNSNMLPEILAYRLELGT